MNIVLSQETTDLLNLALDSINDTRDTVSKYILREVKDNTASFSIMHGFSLESDVDFCINSLKFSNKPGILTMKRTQEEFDRRLRTKKFDMIC